MTAEIAIMNKEAIALASDSAVTITAHDGQKIFTSANKLFNMSKYAPVGIMVYGNANIMGVPWETIIKIYRSKLGKTKFNTLKEYAHNFISFLDDGNQLFPKSLQNEYFENNVISYFEFVKIAIRDKMNLTIKRNGKITYQEIKYATSSVIMYHYYEWENGELIPSITQTEFLRVLMNHEDKIEEYIKKIFENVPLTRYLLNKLKIIAVSLFYKFIEDTDIDGIDESGISGLVIAGFGENNIFPSLEWYEIVGVLDDKLKYRKKMSTKIEHKKGSIIIPFAQKEMVHIFMEGIDPKLSHIKNTYIKEIFNEYPKRIIEDLEKYTDTEKEGIKSKFNEVNSNILKNYFEKIEDFKRVEYIDPVTRVVSMLPKDELASMAESLVNLTKFKRKVTMERETVGGPIDVAVISKGDGFIWIKRKHYFNQELNPNFITNYYTGE